MAEDGLPAMPKGPKKVFIAYLDSHFGHYLVSRFLQQDCEVSGILRDPTSSTHHKVKKVLKRGDTESIRKALLEADIIVYHLGHTVEDPITALRLLSSHHYENEKRFILVSSFMTWFETPVTPPDPEDEDGTSGEALTEDQFNRRVPHIKYQAWRDVEKLCRSSYTERLKTFVTFAGLTYGCGESILHPLFRQAWNLGPEGLPVFAPGRQVIPMIHTTDLATIVIKTATTSELPESRYFFAVDDGACSWKAVVAALNENLGNGRTYFVPPHEFALHENVEQFVINLRVEPGTTSSLLDESDWVAKSGFVENIDMVCKQYKQHRSIAPLRVLALGPPSSGKTFSSRELASALRLPHFTIGDVVSEYKYQQTELQEEMTRIKNTKLTARKQEKVEEKRQQIIEDRKAEQAEKEAEEPPQEADPEAEDYESEEEIEVTLTEEEEKELREAVNEEDDEEIQKIKDKLEEIKKVLLMRVKPAAATSNEPPNPKDKKKPPPKAGKKEEPKPVADDGKEARYSDRALGIMLRWKLSRVQCRNQGYVLDGYPKTVRQAKYLFADAPLDVLEEDEVDPEMEDGPCADSVFPDYVITLKASDTFLLERVQKTANEHPHNAPEEFQRRLEAYKNHFEGPASVVHWLESAKSASGKSTQVKQFEMEGCPLVPPPPPKSIYAPRQVDPIIVKMLDFIGKPHNFGPTPHDAFLESERQRLLLAEQERDREEAARRKNEQEAQDLANAHKAREEESAKLNAIKEHEREMLEQRKGPLKAYLMANVIPVLTKGLIEVCNKRPEDPVDYLAEWLFKHNPEDHPDLYA